jgi:hypothetical protein
MKIHSWNVVSWWFLFPVFGECIGQPLVSIHMKNAEISQVLSNMKTKGYHFLFNSRLQIIV